MHLLLSSSLSPLSLPSFSLCNQMPIIMDSYKASAFSAFQFFSFFTSLLHFNPLPQRTHPTVQHRPHNHRRINGGPLTPLYVALKMPVPALALTISTMANAAQYQQNSSKSGQARANGGRANSDGGRGCFSSDVMVGRRGQAELFQASP